MSLGQLFAIAACVTAFSALGGCAIGPAGPLQAGQARTQVAERDLLAEAAAEVDRAQWSTPQSVSLISWITGSGDDKGLSRSAVVDQYAGALSAKAQPFETLLQDGHSQLNDADRLFAAARVTLGASRVTMNDIVLVEDAIQKLRIDRDILSDTAKALDKAGLATDDDRLGAMKLGFSGTIKQLSEIADLLADRLENDRTSTYAGPDRSFPNRFSDL